MSITINYNRYLKIHNRGKILKKSTAYNVKHFAKRLKILVSAMETTLNPPFKSNQYEVDSNSQLDFSQRKISGSLMRVNHAGEIAAQGLYMGQALFAKDEEVYNFMIDSSLEEFEHLEACHRRLCELGEDTSKLSPLWFIGSVLIGSYFGLKGDKASLGFVAETERQVENHLKGHLSKISKKDHETRKLLNNMIDDERAHGEQAKIRGGTLNSNFTNSAMAVVSEVMKQLSYKI